MVAKTKGAKSKSSLNMISGECSDASGGSGGGVSERTDLRLSVSRIRMSDYETYHHNKEKLKGIMSKKSGNVDFIAMLLFTYSVRALNLITCRIISSFRRDKNYLQCRSRTCTSIDWKAERKQSS